MNALTDGIHELHVVDILNRLRGKSATILLGSGERITGKIADGVDYASAQTHMLRLTQLEGKELFDAVIPKNTVTGFIFRVGG